MCFSGVEASVELFICVFAPSVHTLLHLINISPPSGVEVEDGGEVIEHSRAFRRYLVQKTEG